MSLTRGARLGLYQVTALIGEGGMGQVWQATDTQLNRQVALKILPDAFAADPDRLARFRRDDIRSSLVHAAPGCDHCRRDHPGSVPRGGKSPGCHSDCGRSTQRAAMGGAASLTKR
jgi:hypothetical protein